MNTIESLSFEEKVKLLGELIDDLDIILTAAYGEEAMISSSNIQIYEENKIYIHTGICTG